MKDAIRENNRNHCKADRPCNEILDLKQAGSVRQYFNDIDTLNVYAKMIDHYLIYIILNSIMAWLCQAITHYKDFRSDPFKWKE